MADKGKIAKVFAGRMLLLIPIAFCLLVVISSDDRTIRALAVIGLIILEQAREWLVFSNFMPKAASLPSDAAGNKDNKP